MNRSQAKGSKGKVKYVLQAQQGWTLVLGSESKLMILGSYSAPGRGCWIFEAWV